MQEVLHVVFDTKTYHAILINRLFNISICNFVARIVVADELNFPFKLIAIHFMKGSEMSDCGFNNLKKQQNR